MRRRGFLGFLASASLAGVVAAFAIPRLTAPPVLEVVDASASALAKKYDAPSGLCPWRNPVSDMKAFFPSATSSREEFLALSRYTTEIERKIRRKPTGEETGVQIHRIFNGEEAIGAVAARRVKGESGAIEAVLAIDKSNRVVGVKIQRMREPEAVAKILKNQGYLDFFKGKTVESDWLCHCDQVEISPKALKSVDAVQGALHTLMVLLTIQDIWKKA